MKRFLCILVSLILILGMLPMTAFADETGAKYAVTINGGKAYNADGNEIDAAAPGDTVTIKANAPEDGWCWRDRGDPHRRD